MFEQTHLMVVSLNLSSSAYYLIIITSFIGFRKGMQCFLSRYVKGVPYFTRRCTKGYLYVKITYERVRGWTSRCRPSPYTENLVEYPRVLPKHEKLNKMSHESIKPQLKHCSRCKGRENEPKSRYFCFCLWLTGCCDISLIFIRAETEERLQLFTNLIEVPFFLGICCISRQNERVKEKLSRVARSIENYLFHWQFDCPVRFRPNIIRLLSYNS